MVPVTNMRYGGIIDPLVALSHHCTVAWVTRPAAEGREGHFQAGPKGRYLEVGLLFMNKNSILR